MLELARDGNTIMIKQDERSLSNTNALRALRAMMRQENDKEGLMLLSELVAIVTEQKHNAGRARRACTQ